MASFAQSERSRLADLLELVGPDAPTLCTGWRARDLAAHIVVRERRPDAALGIVVGPLAAHARSVREAAARMPWPQLLARVRSRSPLLVGPLDDMFNSTEFFVHAEDVRRAQPGWQPSPADPHRDAVAWRVLRSHGRALFRRSPVGVVLELPDGRSCRVANASPSVTVTGLAGELLLYGYGRTGHAAVQVAGDPDAVAAFDGTALDV